MPDYSIVSTLVLDVGYLEWNPAGRRTVVLVHGWPDCPEGWTKVAERLAGVGYRILCPALRGFGPTRFRDSNTPRSGQLSALGRDLLEFVDALGLVGPILVGHDWGARAATPADCAPVRRPIWSCYRSATGQTIRIKRSRTRKRETTGITGSWPHREGSGPSSRIGAPSPA
jgi:hypothetical protein